MMRYGWCLAVLAYVLGASFATHTHARSVCLATQAICDVRESVFRIKSFDPYGSAVRIGPDLLVTNRHVVAAASVVSVFTETGKIRGTVVPTRFVGDLVLIRAALPDGPFVTLRKTPMNAAMKLRTIGYDLGQKSIRVYKEGDVLVLPVPGKPLARLHHTAHTQPGNSGGAVVDEEGDLVAIATSGGAGIYEAVPAAAIQKLQNESGDDAREAGVTIGRNYRTCILTTEAALRTRGTWPAHLADQLQDTCFATHNRQLIDLAAQAFGRSRKFDTSVKLFERSLEIDPGAIHSRLGLATSLMFAQKQKAALPHIRQLLTAIPENLNVHRMAIQAGKTAGDQALIAAALEAIKMHNPRGLEAAQRFLDQPARTRRRTQDNGGEL